MRWSHRNIHGEATLLLTLSSSKTFFFFFFSFPLIPGLISFPWDSSNPWGKASCNVWVAFAQATCPQLCPEGTPRARPEPELWGARHTLEESWDLLGKPTLLSLPKGGLIPAAPPLLPDWLFQHKREEGELGSIARASLRRKNGRKGRKAARAVPGKAPNKSPL